jgi:hypothetical protein
MIKKKNSKTPNFATFSKQSQEKRNLRALAPSWQNSLKPPKTDKT